MNVSNLENSKRLYEVSGWEPEKELEGIKVKGRIPSYPAGYLLRKLPLELKTPRNGKLYLNAVEDGQDSYTREWRAGYHNGWFEYDMSPEDALTLLAIKLYEEGILVKEEN